MRKPDFFIVGAPRCGTTSMATWLSKHPGIYMSPVKEPHFYNTDLKHTNIRSRREYDRLFKGARDEHIAVGEASTFYLFSQVAIPRIQKEHPDARYIVMLRNPAEMAYSRHQCQLVAGNEHLHDFAEAWRLSPERREGRAVTRWCRAPRMLDYRSVSRLGEQLERLLRTVSRERVLVLVLDDLRVSPRREYLRVLRFLGVPDDGRMAFPVKNPAQRRRWPRLRRAIKLLLAVRRALRMPRLGTGVLGVVDELNAHRSPRPPLPVELRREIAEYYRADILLLERLLDRSFSHWLMQAEPGSTPGKPRTDVERVE